MTIKTTIVVDIILEYADEAGNVAIQVSNSVAICAPENKPVRIPMSVMPIYTVDKNRVGSSCSTLATSAPLLPFFRSISRRAFLDETKAISDIENMPFKSIRPRMTKISTSIGG